MAEKELAEKLARRLAKVEEIDREEREKEKEKEREKIPPVPPQPPQKIIPNPYVAVDNSVSIDDIIARTLENKTEQTEQNNNNNVQEPPKQQPSTFTVPILHSSKDTPPPPLSLAKLCKVEKVAEIDPLSINRRPMFKVEHHRDRVASPSRIFLKKDCEDSELERVLSAQRRKRSEHIIQQAERSQSPSGRIVDVHAPPPPPKPQTTNGKLETVEFPIQPLEQSPKEENNNRTEMTIDQTTSVQTSVIETTTIEKESSPLPPPPPSINEKPIMIDETPIEQVSVVEEVPVLACELVQKPEETKEKKETVRECTEAEVEKTENKEEGEKKDRTEKLEHQVSFNEDLEIIENEGEEYVLVEPLSIINEDPEESTENEERDKENGEVEKKEKTPEKETEVISTEDPQAILREQRVLSASKEAIYDDFLEVEAAIEKSNESTGEGEKKELEASPLRELCLPPPPPIPTKREIEGKEESRGAVKDMNLDDLITGLIAEGSHPVHPLPPISLTKQLEIETSQMNKIAPKSDSLSPQLPRSPVPPPPALISQKECVPLPPSSPIPPPPSIFRKDTASTSETAPKPSFAPPPPPVEPPKPPRTMVDSSPCSPTSPKCSLSPLGLPISPTLSHSPSSQPSPPIKPIPRTPVDPEKELAEKLERRNKIMEGEPVAASFNKKLSVYAEFPEFSRKQIKYFTETFKKFDEDKDNFIDFMELKRMMEALGEAQTHITLKMIIKKVDEDEDGKISLREFFLIFRMAAAGELGVSSEIFQKLADSIDVTKEGVHNAAHFFQAKIEELTKLSQFEEEIKAEQEEKRQLEEEKKQRREKFLQSRNLFQ